MLGSEGTPPRPIADPIAGPIAVTGANSAIGRVLLAHAERAGRAVIACVRSERAAAALPPLSRPSRVARIDYGSPASLVSAFEEATRVIHLPGILVERPGSSYEQANVETTRAAVAAAQHGRVHKLVLVSAVGADPTSANRYYGSKGRAEQAVRESGLAHTILRAPLVIGEASEGEAALWRSLTRPRPRLLAGGRGRQQPLDAADLARGALSALRPQIAPDRTLDLVGPESLPYAELVERAARLSGRDARVGSLPLPVGVLRAVLRLRSAVLGPGFSADALDVILDEHALDPKPAADALGIELTPLDETLRAMIQRNDA